VRLAVWDIAPASYLGDRLRETLPDYVEVSSQAPSQCVNSLTEGEVDIALIPSLDVLRQPKLYDVIPGVGLASTDSFEYAQLLSDGNIPALHDLSANSAGDQLAALGRIILSEQYGLHEMDDAADAPEDSGTARLHWGKTSAGEGGMRELDLSREWYELTSRPMVWALFAARNESLDPDMGRRFVESVRVLEHQNPFEHVRWAFEVEDLQGLEAFSRYLFYHGFIDEISPIPFVELPEPL
jgi:hypothetical protein